MNRAKFRKRTAALIAAAALAVAACGGDDSSSDDTSAPSETTATDGSGTAPSATVEQGAVGSTEPAGEPVQGGTLNFAVYAETAGLDPTVSQGSGTSGGIELAAIYDTLMTYDPETTEFLPKLAESLTSNEDATVWTLTLRDGVTFSDGTPLDAAAVEFSLQRHVDRQSRFAGMVASIASYEQTDANTLVMTLTESWTGFPFVLAFMPGMIVSPTAVQELGDDAFNRAPIGAGAFTVERYAPGEELVLAANPAYWDGAPYLEKLRFAPILGAQAVLDALGTGEMQAGMIRESLAARKAQDEGYPGFLTVQNAGSTILMNHGRNGVERITQDVRIRQAIAYALDPALLDQRSDEGAGYPTQDLMGATSVWHDQPSTVTYNLDEAKRLVEEVKAETGWDGSITFTCVNAQTRINLAIAVGAMLDAAGFKTTVDTSHAFADLIRIVQVEGDFELACWGLNVGDDAPYIGLSQHLMSTSGQNASGFQSAEFDALLAELRVAPDAAGTTEVLNKIQAQWDLEMPAAIYNAAPELVVWQPNVHGVVPTVKSMVHFDKAFLAAS